MKAHYVALEDAEAAEAVVVIDVLRAFTTTAWAFERGASRVLAVSGHDEALALRDTLPTGTLVAGEEGGRRMDGFDFGNSPSEMQTADLTGADLILRTSAGTQGLLRTVGSRVAFAASFVVASATARSLAEAKVDEVVFVVTGASLGRDGDEDRACGELIAALVDDPHTDPGPYVARIGASDAAQGFFNEAFDWWPMADLELASEVDRFDMALLALADPELQAVELRRHVPHGDASPAAAR